MGGQYVPTVSAHRTSMVWEPDLASVIQDPIVRLLMARDGVSVVQIQEIVARARPSKNRESVAPHSAMA